MDGVRKAVFRASTEIDYAPVIGDDARLVAGMRLAVFISHRQYQRVVRTEALSAARARHLVVAEKDVLNVDEVASVEFV